MGRMISAFSVNVHSKQGLLEPFRFMNSIVPLAGAEVECRNINDDLGPT